MTTAIDPCTCPACVTDTLSERAFARSTARLTEQVLGTPAPVTLARGVASASPATSVLEKLYLLAERNADDRHNKMIACLVDNHNKLIACLVDLSDRGADDDEDIAPAYHNDEAAEADETPGDSPRDSAMTWLGENLRRSVGMFASGCYGPEFTPDAPSGAETGFEAPLFDLGAWRTILDSWRAQQPREVEYLAALDAMGAASLTLRAARETLEQAFTTLQATPLTEPFMPPYKAVQEASQAFQRAAREYKQARERAEQAAAASTAPL